MDPYKHSYKIGDGTKGQHDHYSSVYKQDMVPKARDQSEVNRKSAMDQVTNILLGTGNKDTGISEHTDK